jgi:hypothetical protein
MNDDFIHRFFGLCCHRIKSRKEEEEDNPLEVTLPVVVSHGALYRKDSSTVVAVTSDRLLLPQSNISPSVVSTSLIAGRSRHR